MKNLAKLRSLIFESDNRACFIERERILARLEQELADYHAPDRYAVILSKLLAEVSTPLPKTGRPPSPAQTKIVCV